MEPAGTHDDDDGTDFPWDNVWFSWHPNRF